MDRNNVYFHVEVIGKLYDFPFDDETPKQVLITTTWKRQTKEASETIVWPKAEWDITSMGKYLLYPHQLSTKASVALFHKKTMMPPRHENTILLEYAMKTYYIKNKMVVNLGAIIRNFMLSWMEAPKGTTFPLYH